MPSKAIGALRSYGAPAALTATSDDPVDWATLFAGLRASVPLTMLFGSREANAGEADWAKRQPRYEQPRNYTIDDLQRELGHEYPEYVGGTSAAFHRMLQQEQIKQMIRDARMRERSTRREDYAAPAPAATQTMRGYAGGGPILSDHTMPDMSDGGQLLADPHLYAGGGGVHMQAGGALGKMIRRVRNELGTAEAKRLERAADEVPNLERLYAPKALEGLFRGDNARGVMTLKPEDFEKYATPLPNPLSEESVRNIKSLREVGPFTSVPFFELNKKAQGSAELPFISGHEGRHRMRALREQNQPATIVQVLPRAELREPFPRRLRSDYLDALNAELRLSDLMVRPQPHLYNIEQQRDVQRTPILMPEVYKGGGAVHHYGGGGGVKKTLDEMEAELMRKGVRATKAPDVSRRAFFGLPTGSSSPVAKIPAQELEKLKNAPSVEQRTTRIEPSPTAPKIEETVKKVAETPVSRRTVLKSASGQVLRGMLPEMGVPGVDDIAKSVAQSATPVLPSTLQGLIAHAAAKGMTEDQTIRMLERLGVADEFDVQYMLPAMRSPYDFSDLGEEGMSRAAAMANLIGADPRRPMQMRGPLREIRKENPSMYEQLHDVARDIRNYGFED